MKIERTIRNRAIAQEILDFLNGKTKGRESPVISLNSLGELLFYNAACGIDDDENVLMDGVTPDTFGDGWEDGTVEDVLSTLDPISPMAERPHV